MKYTLILIYFLVLVSLGLSSCKNDSGKNKIYKIGLISGLGGFNDKSFNHSAMEGFSRAKGAFFFTAESRESSSEADFKTNIDYFASNDFDLIICLGYSMSGAVKAASSTYPKTDFLLIDYAYPNVPSNVTCVTFAVDQVSFPAGVLAAYWANLKDPDNPVAGYIAGPETLIMNQFALSYINGIEYFNNKYKENVSHEGLFTSSYADSLLGEQAANTLINTKGVDVIYTFAGITGKGALTVAKAQHKWGIGVDVDQYISLPEVNDILLSSCMKRLDIAVYDVIANYLVELFPGGKSRNIILDDNGVCLAPYHDFEGHVPDSIKLLLNQVQVDIINGTLSTGWK